MPLGWALSTTPPPRASRSVRSNSKLMGELDLRAFLGLTDTVRPGYSGISVRYRVDADAPREELEALCLVRADDLTGPGHHPQPGPRDHRSPGLAHLQREELRMQCEVKPANVGSGASAFVGQGQVLGRGRNAGDGVPLPPRPAARRDARIRPWMSWIGCPEATVDSFAGTGNPFTMGRLLAGERVLDIGCGAGFDALQAAVQVGRDRASSSEST